MFEEPRRGHGGCVVAETGERAGSGHTGPQWPGQEFALSGSKGKVVEGFYLGSTPCLAATWNGGL